MALISRPYCTLRLPTQREAQAADKCEQPKNLFRRTCVGFPGRHRDMLAHHLKFSARFGFPLQQRSQKRGFLAFICPFQRLLSTLENASRILKVKPHPLFRRDWFRRKRPGALILQLKCEQVGVSLIPGMQKGPQGEEELLWRFAVRLARQRLQRRVDKIQELRQKFLSRRKLRQPAQHVDITNSSGRFLNVWLQMIGRIVEAGMTQSGTIHQAIDQFRRVLPMYIGQLAFE